MIYKVATENGLKFHYAWVDDNNFVKSQTFGIETVYKWNMEFHKGDGIFVWGPVGHKILAVGYLWNFDDYQSE